MAILRQDFFVKLLINTAGAEWTLPPVNQVKTLLQSNAAQREPYFNIIEPQSKASNREPYFNIIAPRNQKPASASHKSRIELGSKDARDLCACMTNLSNQFSRD